MMKIPPRDFTFDLTALQLLVDISVHAKIEMGKNTCDVVWSQGLLLNVDMFEVCAKDWTTKEFVLQADPDLQIRKFRKCST